MIVLMAGLPGTGKSTLSRALATELRGTIIDKDQVRAALFSPPDIEYSTEQDDFCMAVMLKVAGYLFRKDSARIIFLDGRTFSQTYQLKRATGFAEAISQPWRILECTCNEATAQRRPQRAALRRRARAGQSGARRTAPGSTGLGAGASVADLLATGA